MLEDRNFFPEVLDFVLLETYVLLLRSDPYVSILSVLEVRNFFLEDSDFVLLETYVLLLRSGPYVSILNLLEIGNIFCGSFRFRSA